MADRTFEDFASKTTPDDTDIFPFKPIGSLSRKITWSELKTALGSVFAASSHNHSGAHITSGTVATARLSTSTGGNYTGDAGKVSIFSSTGTLTASVFHAQSSSTLNFAYLSTVGLSGGDGSQTFDLFFIPNNQALYLPPSSGTILVDSENLGDLDNVATAKTNLGLATDLFAWHFSTTTTAGNPGSGYFRLNHATTPTALYISSVAMSGRNVSTVLSNLYEGDRIYLEDTTDSSKSLLLTISDAVTYNITYVAIPVSVSNGLAQPGNTVACAFRFVPGSRNLDGINVGVLAGDKSSPAEGDLWYNNALGTYRGYDGSGEIVTFSTSEGLETWLIGDGSAHPVSEWITGSGSGRERFADLAAVRTAYPMTPGVAEVELTDQIDWVVIQNELDNIGIGTQLNRNVLLPAGVFVLNRSLTLRGPNVFLQGQGQYDTILKFIADVDGILYDDDAEGRRPHTQRVERLCVAGLTPVSSSKAGIVAGKADRSEDYWWQGIHLNQIMIQGFEQGIFAANMPMLHVESSTILGCTYCVEMAKCDTFLFESCIMGHQQGWDEVLTTGETRIFQIRDSITGDITGPNFAGLIMGGEYGNCQELMLLSGSSTVEIQGINSESFSGAYWIKVVNGDLKLNQVRAANLTTPAGILLYPDVDAPVRLFAELVDFGTYADPVADSGNPLRAQISCRGADYDTPYIVAPELVVKYQDDTGSNTWFTTSRTDGFVPVKGQNHYTRYTDDPTSINYADACLFLRGRTYRVKSETGYARPDHFVSYYQTIAGTSRHSDLINENLIRTVNATFLDTGNVGVGTDTLATVATEASLLWANGMAIEVEAWGVYGATANNKTIILTWLSEVFNSGAYAHNGIAWKLKAKIYRVSASEARYVTTFEVDGLPPQIVCSTASVTTTSASNMVLSAIGTSNNDVVYRGYIVKVLK